MKLMKYVKINNLKNKRGPKLCGSIYFPYLLETPRLYPQKISYTLEKF